MRNISNRIIDEKAFKVYKNIIKLIVQTTMDAYNIHNSDLAGFKKKTYDEVHTYFKDNFLKFADQRDKNNLFVFGLVNKYYLKSFTSVMKWCQFL